MDRSLIINGKAINDESDAYVIAEIGNNHMGDPDLCKKMIFAASESGVQAVKLQKRDIETLYSKEELERPYKSIHSFAETYGAHRKKLELSERNFHDLKIYAESLGLDFLATPYDLKSADFLYELGIAAFKVASADIRSLPLLKNLAATGRPILLSTGGADWSEVEKAVSIVSSFHRQLAVLQCTSIYPTSPEELNLNVIRTYREKFPDLAVGISSHHQAVLPLFLAFALGARIVEVHFTLDCRWKGTDNQFSFLPSMMKDLVLGLGEAKKMLGTKLKKPLENEIPKIRQMGKRLISARSLRKGETLRQEDIGIQSPWNEGVSPMELETLLGKIAKRDIPQGRPFDRTLDF